MMKIKSKKLDKMITTNRKVKWIKGRVKDMFFVEGIEFVNSPSQEILQLKEYISRGVCCHSSGGK
jgi:hypothetical protein